MRRRSRRSTAWPLWGGQYGSLYYSTLRRILRAASGLSDFAGHWVAARHQSRLWRWRRSGADPCDPRPWQFRRICSVCPAADPAGRADRRRARHGPWAGHPADCCAGPAYLGRHAGERPVFRPRRGHRADDAGDSGGFGPVADQLFLERDRAALRRKRPDLGLGQEIAERERKGHQRLFLARIALGQAGIGDMVEADAQARMIVEAVIEFGAAAEFDIGTEIFGLPVATRPESHRLVRRQHPVIAEIDV